MNVIIFWLSAAAFIIVAIMRVTDPLLPIIAKDFALTVGQASIVVTAFAVPYGLFQIVYGPLGDRFGKLRIIVYTLAASCVFTLLCALASSIEWLTAFRFLAGIATAAVVPLSMAFIADNFAYEGRQPVIARYLNGLIMGQIAGGALGGIMAEMFGWRVIFVVFGLGVGAITFGVARFSRHHRETLRAAPLRGRRILRPYMDLLRERRPRHVIIAALIEGGFFFGSGAFIGAFLHHEFALGYGAVGLILACFGAGSLIYSNTARYIVPALGERRMVISGAVVMSACYAGLAGASAWQWCVPILVVCGFGFYLLHNTLQTLATELAPDARGTAVSLFAFALITGQGLGVALLGHVIDRHGYGVAFAITAVAVACLGAWFQAKLRTWPSHAAAATSDHSG